MYFHTHCHFSTFTVMFLYMSIMKMIPGILFSQFVDYGTAKFFLHFQFRKLVLINFIDT